jgi:hypothetical protein
MKQLNLNHKYILVDIDKSDQDLFICFQPANKSCWFSNDIDDLSYYQRNGVVFKKITSQEKAYEFILKHNPKNYESWLIEISNTPFENIPIYKTTIITHDTNTTSCSYKDFIINKINSNMSGIEIMNQLKKFNLNLYNQTLNRCKVDLSDISTKIDILRYAKFHDFIKKNWKYINYEKFNINYWHSWIR